MVKKLLKLITVSLMVLFAANLFAGNSEPTLDIPSIPPSMMKKYNAVPSTGADSSAAVPKYTSFGASVNIEAMIQAAENAGLKGVKYIKLDDGKWEIKTPVGSKETKYSYNLLNSELTKDGREVEISGPQTPVDLTSLRNAVNAAKSVNGKSYKVISIKSEGTYWKVKALSKSKECEVLVNKDSGKIIHSELDD